VARVARKYVPKKEQLAVLVVGNPSELGSQLASLGPVQKLDISIPPPAGLARRATAKPGN